MDWLSEFTVEIVAGIVGTASLAAMGMLWKRYVVNQKLSSIQPYTVKSYSFFINFSPRNKSISVEKICEIVPRTELSYIEDYPAPAEELGSGCVSEHKVWIDKLQLLGAQGSIQVLGIAPNVGETMRILYPFRRGQTYLIRTVTVYANVEYKSLLGHENHSGFVVEYEIPFYFGFKSAEMNLELEIESALDFESDPNVTICSAQARTRIVRLKRQLWKSRWKGSLKNSPSHVKYALVYKWVIGTSQLRQNDRPALADRGIIDNEALEEFQYLIGEGKFYSGEMFLQAAIGSAKDELIIIDNYLNVEILTKIKDYARCPKIFVFTSEISNRLKGACDALNKELAPRGAFLALSVVSGFHGRVMIQDRKSGFNSGHSFKDLGTAGDFITRMTKPEIDDTLQFLRERKLLE